MNSEMDSERNQRNNWLQNIPSPQNESWFLNKCTLPKINKVMLPLKIAQFCWYGGAAVVTMILPVYFKQIGLSVSQQSVIHMVTPILKFIGPAVSGFIADKIGHSKIVLIANLIFTLILANVMLMIPTIKHHECLPSTFEINCSSTNAVLNISEDFYKANLSELKLNLDFKKCSFYCSSQQLNTHEMNFNEMPLLIPENNLSKDEIKSCLQDIQYNDICNLKGIISLNSSWCEMKPFCNLKCHFDNQEACTTNNKDNANYVYLLCFIVIVCFECSSTNCFRFMDVTAMFMVKTHNSSFGRERIWAVLSITILSPLAGYLIKITTTEGKPENYASGIFFFDVMIVVTILTVMKLDVKINPPGKNMWRKIIGLLKKPDVVMFATALLVLGTSWVFRSYFSIIFLVNMNAPAILLGLLPAVNSVAGLPFLATSNWWVKKIGSTNLLILGLISYIVICVGYSFLTQPWYALFYEVLGVFTYHLLWVAVVTHSHEIAPEGLTASVIATAGAVHFGIGKGTGSSVGLIMGRYGGRIAFRFVSVMCAVTALLYAIYIFWKFQYQVKRMTLKQDENAQIEHTSKTSI